MAFTLTQLAALETAIASGELEVSFDGKTVKYRSFDDLNKAYNLVRGQLMLSGQLTDTGKRVSYASFSKD